jgi:exodeoxyribonuclease VII small subunit
MVKKEMPDGQPVKFEEAMKRLEKIVERLEGGGAALDESLALYEEGISLYRQCSSKLEEAKKKIEILTQDGSGGRSGGGGKMKPELFNFESDENDKNLNLG